jgi:acetyl-CoA carboxylase biotin carboxyl carrier protein
MFKEFKELFSMNIEEIKELMKSMEEMQMTRIAIREGEFECELERGSSYTASETFSTPQMAPSLMPASGPVSVVAPSLEKMSAAQEDKSDYITSPVVGTFYSSPAPEEPCFVKVGDRVEKGQVVAIVEAMKVMNEVKSQVSGIVEEILVENQHPVEFGSKIIRLK